MSIQRFDVEFTKDGSIHAPEQVSTLLAGLQGVTDLVVLSHGWNNDMAEARALYDELVGNFNKLLDVRTAPGAPASLATLRGRTFAACQIFWPSKKFADEQLIPGGGAASADAANDTALLMALDRISHDPERLGQTTISPLRATLVAQAKALVPQLDANETARREFVFLLRTLLDPDHASPDDASGMFFTLDPAKLFKQMEGEVAPLKAGSVAGGATSVTEAGGAAGLGDLLKGAKAAARRLANFATYYQMKGRAGTVGKTGLAPVLRRVRARDGALKLHLVGHSFGGRLVTAAVHALDDHTPSVTIALLQAAFSHNGLSQDFDSGQPGGFREVVSRKRASGPIIITHTKNDTAVGIAYPLASRIAFQNASALGDENDPYGGMGRNGAQRTKEAENNAGRLEAVGHIYPFAQGSIYNLHASDFIKNHGDVRGPQVAYAVLAAAASV